MTDETPKITAISPKKLAEILRKSGSWEVSDETIAADIEAGAPVAADGTINMIEYAAWLVRETSATEAKSESTSSVNQ